MKKLSLFILPFMFVALVGRSQNTPFTEEGKQIKRCATTEYMELLKSEDPTLEAQLAATDEYINNWIAGHPDGSGEKTVITVPVVVHLIYYNTNQNLTDARVQEQIDVLNTDYAGLNTHSMESFATSLKANTELQFCLAQRTPAGALTTGIERRQTTVSQFSYGSNMKHYSTGGLDQWDPNKYMNIWVCNLGSSLCGFAEFPTYTLSSTFGVVIHYQFFGVTGASYPYNLGGTTTHEIGHCFNLYHIWGDDGGSCSGTDACSDTPNQASENYGNHSGVLTDACTTTSPGIMYMNFMDYSDDIDYANFTPTQKLRIQALFAAGGYLDDLKTSNGCTPGTGINEMNEVTDINIYPNPSGGLFHLMFELNQADDITVTVSDLIGNIIVKEEMQQQSTFNIPIDLSEQSAGVYYVKIQTGSETVTQKLSLIK
ncbi:MAG: M43 family zinc metalloprotease [Bacteroidota bacterium]